MKRRNFKIVKIFCGKIKRMMYINENLIHYMMELKTENLFPQKIIKLIHLTFAPSISIGNVLPTFDILCEFSGRQYT